MVTLGKRARTLEKAANPNHHHHHQTNKNGETQTPTDDSQNVSRYEQFRAERIKENLDRMQKLGSLDLSLKLKSLKPTPKNSPFYRKTRQHFSPLPPSGAIRRSSGYLPPEFFMHGVVDEKTDVYAYGVLLLELITERLALDKSQQSLLIWVVRILKKDGDILDRARKLLKARSFKRIYPAEFLNAEEPNSMVYSNNMIQPMQIALEL